ncbi:hypothetical protein ACSBR1_017828 [Camellia fascicularis]
MEHFGEGPSMGLSPHGPSTAMHTPQTSPPECTNYTSQFAPEVDPLMSEHTSTHHGHILDPSWSPPPYRTAVGTPVTPLAPLSTTCLSTVIPSASTLTAPDPFTVPSSPTPHITFTYHVDPLITHDFHIDGEGEGQVHAPTSGTGRGRGCGGRRGLSAVCEGLPEVVSNDCTAPIGDVQPASTEAGEGVVRAAAQDIQRIDLQLFWLKRSHSLTYIGCIKKGPVITDSKLKWNEKSGHLIGSEYVLHAYGPIYVLSAEVVASLAIVRNSRLIMLAWIQ